MPKLPECDRCQLYARNPHLVCAVHPMGVESNQCPDYAPDLTLEPEDLWEPVGAAYYNGELILQPQPRWDQMQQLALLDWHPLFTGRCPHCEIPIPATDPPPVHWDCVVCGWKDESI